MTAMYPPTLDGMLAHRWVTPSCISPAPLPLGKKGRHGLKIRVKGNEDRPSTRIHDLPIRGTTPQSLGYAGEEKPSKPVRND